MNFIVVNSYTQALNATLAPDWAFYRQALELAEKQKQSLGRPDSVARLLREFVDVRGLLMSHCDKTNKADHFAKHNYAPPCKQGCGEQRVLSCIFETFDECLRKDLSEIKDNEVDSTCKEIKRIDAVFQASVGI